MAKLANSLMREITMRRLGLALVVLAAIPAAAIPLLACVVAISAPAALIAGIAGFSTPSHAAHESGATTNPGATAMVTRR
jgi:hypothetical protein